MRVCTFPISLKPPITLPSSSRKPILPLSRSRNCSAAPVVQKLVTIGEAAARIPEVLKARYPEVPWPQIVAFRNIPIHSYFGIEWDVVWRAATGRCPTLRVQIAAIRDAESGSSDDDHGRWSGLKIVFRIGKGNAPFAFLMQRPPKSAAAAAAH